jgi:hypothetical protein
MGHEALGFTQMKGLWEVEPSASPILIKAAANGFTVCKDACSDFNNFLWCPVLVIMGGGGNLKTMWWGIIIMSHGFFLFTIYHMLFKYTRKFQGGFYVVV